MISLFSILLATDRIFFNITFFSRVFIMKRLWLYELLIITGLLLPLFFISGCAPKMLVPPYLPPEQRAHIKGTTGGSVFAGASIVAVDGEALSSANSAYILPGPHTVTLQYNRPGGGGSIGPVELEFTAEAGGKYTAKWHYSWSKSIYYFSIVDAKTGEVVVSGGEIPPP